MIAGVVICAACGGSNDAAEQPHPVMASPSAASTITVADLVGMYDLHVESDEPTFSGASSAVVSLDDDGGLQLRLDFAASVTLISGTLVGDGHLVLEGSGTIGSDAFDVLGTAIVDTGPHGLCRITGSINGLALGSDTSPTIHFVLERPGTPRR